MVSFVFLSGYSVSFIKYSEKWMREGVRGMDGLREKMNIELRWPMVVAWTRVPVSVWKKVEAFETCFGVSFPCGSAGKESACNAGDLGSIPGLGRPPGEGKVYPLQYSSLENSMNCKSWALLSNFHFTFRLASLLFSCLGGRVRGERLW